MAPFNIRRRDYINDKLDTRAIVSGFVNFPLYSYNDYGKTEWKNDLIETSCPFV